MAEKIEIAKLEIDLSSVIKSTTEVKKSMQLVKKEQDLLKASGQEASAAFTENAGILKNLTSVYNNNIKVISQSTEATFKETQGVDLLNIALTDEITTISEARAQNKLLNKLRNDTNATTVEGQAQIDKLNNKLDANNEFIKENADAYLQQKINIGNYSDSIKEAFGQLNIFNGGISGFIGRAQQAGGVGNLLTTSLKGITAGIGGMIKASLAFLATPIGLAIAAIGVVLGTVINYLKSTQSGIDAVTSVTRPLMAVFQSLIGVLQDVGEFMIAAFKNPKKELEGVYNYVKDKVIKQFNALYDIVVGIATLDFSQAQKGFKDLGDNIKDIVTDAAKAAQATGEFFSEAIEKGKQIDQLTKDIERSEISLNKEREISKTKIKELDKIAKDTSKTTEERLKANAEQNRLATEVAATEDKILDNKIKLLKIEQSLNDTTREGEKELADLEAEKEKIKQRVLDEELKGIRVISQAQKENEANAKKAVDAGLKEQQNLLKLYIEQQGTRAKTLQEELVIAQNVSTKKLEILKNELAAKKISETEYGIEELRIKNEVAKKENEINVEVAAKALEDFKNNNQSKIDANQFFTDELLDQETKRLQAVADAEKKFADKQLEEGVINRTEYNAAIDKIDEDNRVSKEEAEKKRAEAKKETEAIDVENQRLLDEQAFEDKLSLDLARLERERLQEVAQAEKAGADVKLINDRFANSKKELNEAAAQAKVESDANALGQIAGLLGDESALGKFAALTQAGINVQVGVTKAIAQGGLAGIATGAVVAAKGAATVAKIAGVTTKFEQGGIQEVGGKRHSAGGTKFVGSDGTRFEAERGEGIGVLSRSAFKGFMAFNNSFAGGSSNNSKFAGGGIITQAVRPSNQNADLAELQRSIANMKIQVAVEDINTGQGNYADIVNGANV